MKAVGEVGSMPVLSAVDDFPYVKAVAGVLIWRDSRGRLGGEEDSELKDIVTVGEYVFTKASIIGRWPDQERSGRWVGVADTRPEGRPGSVWG